MRRILLGASAFVLLVALLPQSVQLSRGAQTTTVTLTPIEDAYIDSFNNDTNYGGAWNLLVEYYYVNATYWRKIQGWLKFSLASIPPQATIQTAVLSVWRTDAGSAMTLTAARCTNNSWYGSTLTWSNAPLDALPADSSYTSSVVLRAGSLAPGWYSLNVLADVQNAFSSGVLTEVLRVYPALGSDFSASFYSSEGVYAPTLSITYSYASASVSVSPASATYGQSVTVIGDTDPRQTTGAIKLQYSLDNATWVDLVSATGGAYNYTWTPPSAGTLYLRSVWSTAWTGGSYTATSNVTTLSVGKAPSYLSLHLSDTTLYPGRSVILTASLSPPVSTGTVTLQYSTTGVEYTQITNATPTAGSFMYAWSPPGVGTYYLRAAWTGDAYYNASTSPSQTLTVTLLPTRMTFAAPTAAKVGEAIALTATLRDNDGNTLSGASITFRLNATALGTVATGASGTASAVYTLTVPAGTYVLKASYAGSSVYQAAEESVTIIVNPLRLVLTGPVAQAALFQVNGVNYTTDASGKAVVRVNSTGTYTFAVNSPLPLAAGTRLVFQQWTDGWGSASRTVVMDLDQSFAVVMKTQFYLATASAYGAPEGSGWYDVNATARFSVAPIVDHGNRTRRVFTGWSGDVTLNETSGSILMTSPKTVTAEWKKQFYVSLSSTHGAAGGEGWYDAGATAVINLTPTTVDAGNRTRYIFAGWTGDLNATDAVASLLVDGPKNVTASWRTEYFLEVKPDRGRPTGAGWHPEGSYVNVSVESEAPAEDWTGALGGKYVFEGWTGDLVSPQRSVTVLMDSPKTLTARWRPDYLQPLALLGGAALVVVLVAAYAALARRPRPRERPKETGPTA
ncbi:MAG: Ig-like domain repeat protein [Candidatus Bathyarchaeia archaeon]